MTDIPRIKSADPLPGTRLAVTFDDGSSGVIELADNLEALHAQALADADTFKTARARGFSVTWDDADVDIDGQWLYAKVNGLRAPVNSTDVERNVREVSLRRLRERLAITQVELAAAMGVAQGDISRLERREDALVSSLQRYVKALGGELEIVATVGSERLAVKLG